MYDGDQLTKALLSRIGELTLAQKKELLSYLDKANFQDRRQFPRVPFFVDVKPEQQVEYLKDFATNISIEGAFIETSIPLNIGERLRFSIALPGLLKPIQFEGVVVRRDERGVGIQFDKPLIPVEKYPLPPVVGAVRLLQGRILETIKTLMERLLPKKLFQYVLLAKSDLRHLFIPIRKLKYRGHTHYCPVCQSNISGFIINISASRPSAYCPVCRCLERHRLDWLFLESRTDLFDGSPKKMLHVAPEDMFRFRFLKLEYLEYITVDLNNPKAMYNFDITDMPFPPNSFDVIYCSHVLEHIPDDRKAIRELYRVLRYGGWSLLQVPVTAEKTFEDPSVTDPLERKKLFGHHDHVRRYGPDFKERLEEAGFETHIFWTKDVIKEHTDLFRLGIQENRMIFYCTKT